MPVSGRILIIDDEAALRQTFTRILRQAGWEVTTAGDGPEALELLKASAYDLAYLDIHLPGMSGVEVLKEMHRRYPQLPVILFTAHASVETAVEAVRLGAADYLIKPIDPDALIARTRTMLTEQAAQRRINEIRAQIEALQVELRALETAQPSGESAAAPAPALTGSTDRFLKRGPLILDRQTRRATFGEKVLAMPPAAFDYLVVLTRHAPDVVEYQTLVAEAQGYQSDWRQAQELAKWHIHELREAMEPDPREPQHIINVRGTGYRLVVD